MSEHTPFFTIFIPSYNRAYCISDAILSCNESSFKNFEVVLIDDGSSDNTENVVTGLLDKINFPLRYYQQLNGGKHTAFNHAVKKAKGLIFLTLDSDDTLLPDGLLQIYTLWKQFTKEEQKIFASIGFRCLVDGDPSTAYPEPYLDSDYLTKKRFGSFRGEKRSAYRLEVLKEYPYPTFEGERYCRPGLIDIRIAKKYKTRFSNITVIDVGHNADGICANRRKVVANAPQAYRQYFLEQILYASEYCSKKELKGLYKRFARSSLNAGISIQQMLQEVPHRTTLLLTLPEAWLGARSDRKLRSVK